MPKARCPDCGFVVTYVAGYDPVCPQCGFRAPAPRPSTRPVRPSAQAAMGWTHASPSLHDASPSSMTAHEVRSEPRQGMAVAALVTGLAAFIAPPASLAAIVLGAVALGQANREPQAYGGKGMATAGLVLGCVVAVFWVLVFGTFDWWIRRF